MKGQDSPVISTESATCGELGARRAAPIGIYRKRPNDADCPGFTVSITAHIMQPEFDRLDVDDSENATV